MKRLRVSESEGSGSNSGSAVGLWTIPKLLCFSELFPIAVVVKVECNHVC